MPHLPSHHEDQVPWWGRDREGMKTRFRITAPPLVFQFHLALPPVEDTNGTQEKRKCSLFMSTWTLWIRQDTRTFPHPPPTYRCSSPAQGLRMLHLDPSSSTERNWPGINTNLTWMKSWSGVYKRRSWTRDVGNSEWDMIQHKGYVVLKGLVAWSYTILCDLMSVACQHLCPWDL